MRFHGVKKEENVFAGGERAGSTKEKASHLGGDVGKADGRGPRSVNYKL